MVPSAPSPRREGWAMPHRWERERERKQPKRETESELRLEEIHHGVRRTDTTQPQIHHCSHVWRHNWTQETSGLEMRSAEVEGGGGKTNGQQRRPKSV